MNLPELLEEVGVGDEGGGSTLLMGDKDLCGGFPVVPSPTNHEGGLGC